MKKIITMALVLVMALSLAAPALAYTTNTVAEAGSSPYTIEIYLVDHAGVDLLANLITYPATDRGYAKNEIIAAIGRLTIPKDESLWDDGYTQLRFKPQNVSLNVTDNNPNQVVTSGVAAAGAFDLINNLNAVAFAGFQGWNWTAGGELTHGLWSAPAVGLPQQWWPLSTTNERTIRFLVFGKVTDDDAKLSFQLRRAPAWIGTTPVFNGVTIASVTHALPAGYVLNKDYVVYANSASQTAGVWSPARANRWFIFANDPVQELAFDPATMAPDDLMFQIETVGSKGATARLWMYPNGAAGTEYRIHVEPSTQELVFVITANPPAGKRLNDQIKFGTAGYTSLLAFYNEYFENGLGFTAYNEGNYLTTNDWGAIAAAAIDISDTVDIEPWTPYVSVPDNIVTNPPKTGEAASLIGFVMIVLAAAAAVVVKKVRA